MGCSYVSDVTATSIDNIPLTQRRKLLHSRSGHSRSHDSDSPFVQNDRGKRFTFDAIVKKEYEECDLQVACPAIQTDISAVEKASVNVSSLPQCTTLCDVPITTKVEESEILLSSVDNAGETSLQLDYPAPKIKKEISKDVIDDLDHIVLKERQRMLLARKHQGLSNSAFECGGGGLMENITQHTEKVNEEFDSADEKAKAGRDQCNDILEGSNASALGTTSGSSLSTDCASPKSRKPILSAGHQEQDHVLKSREMFVQFDSYEEQDVMPINNDGPSSSTCPTSVKVKEEPWDNNGFYNVNRDAMGSTSIELPYVKTEWDVPNEYHDQLEHMCLIDRLNFITSGEDSSLNISVSNPSFKKTRPSSFTSRSAVSESAEALSIKHPRKRRKTATDSVQTALEEDAPGLLQVLLNKGVFVDEIKLYGETDNDEALDESFCEDSFLELEAVISKIFSHRPSFIKFPIIRAAKASRANYCLACLISLVEQTRYLKFREWPVEWGWCRDLQSFIFVFEKHNRIVLERPEYGYATYFFELMKSLPVEWQIKRLVIAMKLTTCSRISLIENKELVVGEDLTEGEAKVLMEYGWTPNTGLGTMLNYCDRVMHDRRNEDSSEWRSKIGKLLMDGYNGGSIVTPYIPKKVVEYMCSQSSTKVEQSDI